MKGGKQLEIVNINGQLVTDSRDVAEMVGKQHAHLMRDIKGYAEILNESNFGLVNFFIESTYKDSKGETRPCYLLTRKGCDMVANKMTGQKGVLFTATYVTRFEEMEKQLQSQPNYHLPSTFKEALYMLAEQVDINEQLEQQIENDREKVTLANAITTSDEGLLIEAAAKYLRQNGINIGRDRLFKWLRGQGYLVSRKGREYNMPTQKSLNQGLMKIHAQQYFDSEGELKVNRQVVVTGKGLMFFINKFLHDGQMRLQLD